MKLKLTRQQTELTIDYFYPYLHRKEEAARYSKFADGDKLFMQMFFSCLNAVEIKMQRRLLTDGKQFTFSFPMHEAAALQKAMQIVPIPKTEDHLLMLATLVITQLDKQL